MPATTDHADRLAEPARVTCDIIERGSVEDTILVAVDHPARCMAGTRFVVARGLGHAQ